MDYYNDKKVKAWECTGKGIYDGIVAGSGNNKYMVHIEKLHPRKSTCKYPFAVSCDGKYYKRSGSTLHELNGFELQNFLSERAGKTWDAVPVPEVKVSDLSKDALDAFRKKAVKSNRMTESEVSVSDELLLRNLKLFDSEYLTRAAILLFHSIPEHYVTGSYIKIGYFR